MGLNQSFLQMNDQTDKQQDYASQLFQRLLQVSHMLEYVSSCTISIILHMPSHQALGIECCWSKVPLLLSHPHQVLHQGPAGSKGFSLPGFEGLLKLLYCSELSKNQILFTTKRVYGTKGRERGRVEERKEGGK